MTIPDRGTGPTARWAAGLAALLFASSCLYDSSWADPQRAQQAAALRATPSALRATPETTLALDEAGARKHSRTLHVRAHATPRYAAEVVDWQRQLADLITDANEVLGPTVSVRLELTTTEVWAPRAPDDDLQAMLDEVSERDPGAGVEWVVGLIGSVPRFERSFHQLGLGRAGKQFVVRAMNDAREYEGIQSNLAKLDEEERRKLYRVRKRHKTTAVFLHELAHTLGVIHEVERTTLMAPTYDPKEEGFSDGAATWMRLSLDHRLDPASQTERAFGQTVLDHLRKTAPGWVPAERDALIAQLEARNAAPAPRSRSAAQAAGPPVTTGDLAALGALDRAAFDAASESLRAGRAPEAWSRAKPLFTTYPDVATVQDLRCQIAMKLGLSWDEASAQCERLLQLTTAPPARPGH